MSQHQPRLLPSALYGWVLSESTPVSNLPFPVPFPDVIWPWASPGTAPSLLPACTLLTTPAKSLLPCCFLPKTLRGQRRPFKVDFDILEVKTVLAEKTTPGPGCWEYWGSVWVQGQPGDPQGRGPMGVVECAATAQSMAALSGEPLVGSPRGLWCDAGCGALQERGARTRSVPRGAPASPFPMGITRDRRVPVH